MVRSPQIELVLKDPSNLTVLCQAYARLAAMSSKDMSAESPLDAEMLRKLNAYWRAANFLSVGQIFLYDNPLLKKKLRVNHM